MTSIQEHFLNYEKRRYEAKMSKFKDNVKYLVGCTHTGIRDYEVQSGEGSYKKNSDGWKFSSLFKLEI